ncbi:MAG: aminotransferase class I/II-fold pyridoxal phosphate-dependent enzyme [Bacteroidota bacterium]
MNATENINSLAIARTTQLTKLEIAVLSMDHHRITSLFKRLMVAHPHLLQQLPAELVFVGFDCSKEAINYFEQANWRGIKAVLLDWKYLREGTSELLRSQVVNLIQRSNRSICLFGIEEGVVAAETSPTDQLLQLNRRGLLDERTAAENFARVLEQSILRKLETPFWDAFLQYVYQSTNSWHVPGHNRGGALMDSAFAQSFFAFFGENTFAADHAVPRHFGSLHDHKSSMTDVLTRARHKIAKETFHTAQSFFVTGGNSAANRILLQTLIQPGDEVLVARNCHKSVHYALLHTAAKTTYLSAKFSAYYEMVLPPSTKEIAHLLEERQKSGAKPFKLLVVTSCNYEGVVMDVRALNKLCQSYGTKLFVDEAWYAYSNFHPQFQSTSATLEGVPYVTQSAHKMLAAFRPAAFIHINDPDFDLDYFMDVYNAHTTTSPQFQLIASMDVAAMQMRMEGYELLDKALAIAADFKRKAKYLRYFQLVTPDDLRNNFAQLGFDAHSEGICFDPLKVSFDVTKMEMDIRELCHLVRREACVDIIKYTRNCIQILFTIGSSAEKANALFRTFQWIEQRKKELSSSQQSSPSVSSLHLPSLTYSDQLPIEYFRARREWLALDDPHLLAYKSATFVTPYPPGIPLLLPGETIREHHVQYLQGLLAAGHLSIHGMKEGGVFVCAAIGGQDR